MIYERVTLHVKGLYFVSDIVAGENADSALENVKERLGR